MDAGLKELRICKELTRESAKKNNPKINYSNRQVIA
jgi:hypothetical protein